MALWKKQRRLEAAVRGALEKPYPNGNPGLFPLNGGRQPGDPSPKILHLRTKIVHLGDA